MRTIAEYLQLPYHDHIVRSETTDGEPSWFGTVNELAGLTTSSLTLKDMDSQLQDAKRAWFEAAIELGREIPEPQEEDHSVPEYSGRLGLRIAKGLHRAVAERAAQEGISLTQFASNVLAGAVGYGSPPISVRASGGFPGSVGAHLSYDPSSIVFGATMAEKMRQVREEMGGMSVGPSSAGRGLMSLYGDAATAAAGREAREDLGLVYIVPGDAVGDTKVIDVGLGGLKLVPNGTGGYELVAADTEAVVKGDPQGR